LRLHSLLSKSTSASPLSSAPSSSTPPPSSLLPPPSSLLPPPSSPLPPPTSHLPLHSQVAALGYDSGRIRDGHPRYGHLPLRSGLTKNAEEEEEVEEEEEEEVEEEEDLRSFMCNPKHGGG